MACSDNLAHTTASLSAFSIRQFGHRLHAGYGGDALDEAIGSGTGGGSNLASSFSTLSRLHSALSHLVPIAFGVPLLWVGRVRLPRGTMHRHASVICRETIACRVTNFRGYR